MNDARFTGNLTRDPETRMMTNGKPRSMFTLAVPRQYANQQTGKREADFITFVAYGTNADIASKYLAKGRKVLVISHVKTGSYQKDGTTIYTTEFVVDHIEFLSAPTTQDQQEPEALQHPDQPQQVQDRFADMSSDELPY